MASPAASDDRAEPAGNARLEFVRAMAETSPAMLWMGDEVGKCVFLNRALRSFWGVDPENLAEFDWSTTVHPDDVEKLSGPFGRAMADHTSFTVEARYKRADGAYRTMRTLANPRFGENGAFLGMTGVNIDVTDELAAEEHTRLLMAELNHRTKNILAVVQAIARSTIFRDPKDFLRSFGERLQSLSACNDLLLRTDWSGVLLDELVAAQMSHLSGIAEGRILASGPTIRIGSREAQTLSMALHELCTNSLKYGALSDDRGKVRLSWERTGEGAWQMEWREEASTPPAPPERKGFGQTVIVDMVRSGLEAEVMIDFPPEGFVWRMTSRVGA
jgi:PAS domain S-box-containing protein